MEPKSYFIASVILCLAFVGGIFIAKRRRMAKKPLEYTTYFTLLTRGGCMVSFCAAVFLFAAREAYYETFFMVVGTIFWYGGVAMFSACILIYAITMEENAGSRLEETSSEEK